jgi:hypothetical protein
VFLTGVNILNLVMFRVSSIAAQSSAACLGQAVTMIMSQRIILSLHDWRTTLQVPSSNYAHAPLYELSAANKGTRRTNAPVSAGATEGSGFGSTAAATTATVTVSPGSSHPNSPAPNAVKYAYNMPRSLTSQQELDASTIDLRADEAREDCDSVYAQKAKSGYHENSVSCFGYWCCGEGSTVLYSDAVFRTILFI